MKISSLSIKLVFVHVLITFTVFTLKGQTFSFSPAPNSPITNVYNQRGIISHDVNMDGIKDLLIANPTSSTLRVMLGSGNGQFTNAQGSPFSISAGPIYIAVADFNGDTYPDLATANYNSFNVSILLGNGTGVFVNAPNSPIAVGLYPYCVDAADFNQDGNIDLVTSCVNSNNVYVLMGNGAGTFTVATGSPFSAGGMPYHVSCGLFNADNLPDLAVANGTGNTVGVYFGVGNGSLTLSASYTVGSQPRTISVKDLNGDSELDLVVTNFLSSNVHVLLGSANGIFANALGSPISMSTPYQSAVADFDSNGTQDIAITNDNTSSITLLSGNGNGGFTAATNSPLYMGNSSQPICTADFNGDGSPDLASGEWNGNKIHVLLNTYSLCQISAGFTYIESASGIANFTSTSTGTNSNTSYTWNFGDGNSGSGIFSSHTYSANGVYTVTLTATNPSSPGCSDTYVQTIVVQNIKCVINAIYTYSMSSTPGLVYFTSVSTGTDANSSYSWNFGNSTTSTGPIISHQFSGNGTYSVTLTVVNTSSTECYGVSTQTIVIQTIVNTIVDRMLNTSIRIYPNPSSGILQISNDNLPNDPELVLYNLLGQEKLRLTLPIGVCSIDLSKLENGLYYLNYLDNGKMIISKPIVLIK